MKNFLILALVAALLFSISAALSLWLNQSRQMESSTEKDKTSSKTAGEKEPAEQRESTKTEPKTSPKSTPLPLGPDPTTFREREAQLARRAAQIDMVVRDLQVQRELVDSLVRQVATELKTATGKLDQLQTLANQIEKKKSELSDAEKQNIGRIASMLDTMTPEGAARVIVQIADSGKLENAARVLVLMKDRQIGRVLDQLDPALAAQLLDRVRANRVPALAPTPSAGTGTIPAGGVPPRTP
jgi:flagellar motility protein MotE (MotC chaperone)